MITRCLHAILLRVYVEERRARRQQRRLHCVYFAHGGTQNGGSVAQRQFCRGRQNCAARKSESSGLLSRCLRMAFDVRPAMATSSGFHHAASTLFMKRVGARWSLLESIFDARHDMRICFDDSMARVF